MADLREKLAEAAHDRWVRVKRHLFDTAMEVPAAGILIVDTDNMELWARRADTPFAELSLEDREAYRAEADLLLAVIESFKEPEPEPGPEPEPRYATVKGGIQWLNFRSPDGKDIGDLVPGATFEVIGEDGDRYKIAAWAWKGGFE